MLFTIDLRHFDDIVATCLPHRAILVDWTQHLYGLIISSSKARWLQIYTFIISVSERRDFNYSNYAHETNVKAAPGRMTCPERYTFITANLLQGLNIVGKIQNMTSALHRLTQVRTALSSMEGGAHLCNMASAPTV